MDEEIIFQMICCHGKKGGKIKSAELIHVIDLDGTVEKVLRT
ncbi:MAG: hypothetical protein SRB2_00348 [Desulfobacteraceae bacterium Eth-SRB2]|nr:MAG: hypothetical protein SRB2_00348 [Desulfobacteraceae bacterium Eth-SRB2]